MAEPLITDEMRALIGIKGEPTVIQIEKEPIRRWAEAIGDPNPVYQDEAYARKLGLASLMVPPSGHGRCGFILRQGSPRPQVKSPFWRRLNGGGDWEFYRPAVAGDTLTITSWLSDVYERQGRPGIGRMLIQEVTSDYVNQRGELVARARNWGITYEGPTAGQS